MAHDTSQGAARSGWEARVERWLESANASAEALLAEGAPRKKGELASRTRPELHLPSPSRRPSGPPPRASGPPPPWALRPARPAGSSPQGLTAAGGSGPPAARTEPPAPRLHAAARAHPAALPVRVGFTCALRWSEQGEVCLKPGGWSAHVGALTTTAHSLPLWLLKLNPWRAAASLVAFRPRWRSSPGAGRPARTNAVPSNPPRPPQQLAQRSQAQPRVPAAPSPSPSDATSATPASFTGSLSSDYSSMPSSMPSSLPSSDVTRQSGGASSWAASSNHYGGTTPGSEWGGGSAATGTRVNPGTQGMFYAEEKASSEEEEAVAAAEAIVAGLSSAECVEALEFNSERRRLARSASPQPLRALSPVPMAQGAAASARPPLAPSVAPVARQGSVTSQAGLACSPAADTDFAFSTPMNVSRTLHMPPMPQASRPPAAVNDTPPVRRRPPQQPPRPAVASPAAPAIDALLRVVGGSRLSVDDALREIARQQHATGQAWDEEHVPTPQGTPAVWARDRIPHTPVVPADEQEDEESVPVPDEEELSADTAIRVLERVAAALGRSEVSVDVAQAMRNATLARVR